MYPVPASTITGHARWNDLHNAVEIRNLDISLLAIPEWLRTQSLALRAAFRERFGSSVMETTDE